MIQKRLSAHLLDGLALADPRLRGKGLTAGHGGEWRFQMGDHRILPVIDDSTYVVPSLTVGPRSASSTGSADLIDSVLGWHHFRALDPELGREAGRIRRFRRDRDMKKGSSNRRSIVSADVAHSLVTRMV